MGSIWGVVFKFAIHALRARRMSTNGYEWLHNFCAGCAEKHVDNDDKILPKSKVSCECSCHEDGA